MCLINKGLDSINHNVSNGYKQSLIEYQNKCKKLTIGYVSGIIKHNFHGQKIKRFYSSQWMILTTNNYDPYEHIELNEDGLMIATNECSKKLLEEIREYFKSRDEDEFMNK